MSTNAHLLAGCSRHARSIGLIAPDFWEAVSTAGGTSTDLLALEDYPATFAFDELNAKAATAAAHAGEESGLDPVAVRSVARSLDETVAKRC